MNGKLAALGVATGTLPTMIIMDQVGKKTGKPIGVPGSFTHILSNNKISSEDKFQTLNKITKEQIKDGAKALTLTATAAGIAGVAAKKSEAVGNAVQEGVSQLGKLLQKVSVNGKDLKAILNNNSLVQTFKGLPTPVKAAVLAGGAALTTILPFLTVNAFSKAGYIEGQKEAANQEANKIDVDKIVLDYISE